MVTNIVIVIDNVLPGRDSGAYITHRVHSIIGAIPLKCATTAAVNEDQFATGTRRVVLAMNRPQVSIRCDDVIIVFSWKSRQIVSKDPRRLTEHGATFDWRRDEDDGRLSRFQEGKNQTESRIVVPFAPITRNDDNRSESDPFPGQRRQWQEEGVVVASVALAVRSVGTKHRVEIRRSLLLRMAWTMQFSIQQPLSGVASDIIVPITEFHLIFLLQLKYDKN